MAATEQSRTRNSGEIDGFFIGATRELNSSVELIDVYAALLDAQLAEDPSLSGLRAIVHDLRAQARLVAELVAHALEFD